MEYQKVANLLDSASKQPSKFRTRNWVEKNDKSRGAYTGNGIKFKTTMLRSDLYDYADAYILAAARRADERELNLKIGRRLLNA